MSDRPCGFGAQLGLGVALALGLFGSSMYVSNTIEKIKSTDHAIDVKGYAERKIKSDIAVWQGILVTRDKDLSVAFQKLDKERKQVLSFFEKEGLKPELTPLIKETLYILTTQGARTNNIEGFVLRQNFSISSNDVQKISATAIKVDQLNAEGLEFESMEPRYFYSREKLDQLKIELLGEATRNAKERADQLAKSSGGASAGRLLNARQGIFQVTSENSTDVSDMGGYDTSTIDKVVKIVVTLSYATKN